MSTIGRTAGVLLVILVTGVVILQERDSRRILGGASVWLDVATARVGVWR